jgi:phenylpropionate dioxygenase-like ring-hydroxylating dioxygenase large terminal subunit
VALLDICPHKLTPMSIGKKIGDVLQCGYHWLEFDSTGKCIQNPQGNGIIPAEAKLRSLSASRAPRRPLGADGRCGNGRCRQDPDFAFIDDTNRRTQKGNHHVHCNYMMLVENLMGLDHAMFLHRQTGGLTDPSLADNKVDQTNDEVRDLRLHHAKPPPFFAPYLNSKDNVDIWTDIRWNAPSMILNTVGCSPAGTNRISGGMSTLGAHFLTPETSTQRVVK